MQHRTDLVHGSQLTHLVESESNQVGTRLDGAVGTFDAFDACDGFDFVLPNELLVEVHFFLKDFALTVVNDLGMQVSKT
jgi:hypothetical protein